VRRIILSRKGFDTVNGGFPSPIFPDNTLISIPIPSKINDDYYKDLAFKYNNVHISKILNDLTNNQIKINGKTKKADYTLPKFKCHYDPQIMNEYFTLGQTGSALGHLNNQNVGVGDIFLFYGLFQKVEYINNKWQYIDRPFHYIFAYMEIEDVLEVNNSKILIPKKYEFLRKHPHLQEKFLIKYPYSKIYCGKKFKYFNFDNKRILTDLDKFEGVSKWKLPLDFDFTDSISFIKYMKISDNHCYINHKGYGQEFVINLETLSDFQRNKIINYIKDIII